MKGRFIFSLIILAISTCYVVWLGTNILVTLGWASFLLPIIWIILALSLRLKTYYAETLLFVLTLAGFVVANHITYISVEGQLPLNIVNIYLYLLPTGLIYVPFTCLMDTPFLKTSKLPDKNPEVFKNYRKILCCLAILPIFITLALLCLITRLSLVPFFLFIPYVLSLVVLLATLGQLPAGEMEYLLQSLHRVTDQGARCRVKSLLVIFVALTVLAVLLEYFRGLWLYGLLYACVLSFICLNLLIVYQHSCHSPQSSPRALDTFHVPAISLPWIGGILYVSFVIYIIVISTMGLNQITQFFKIR